MRLWRFAIAVPQLPHDNLCLLYIWKKDYFTKRVCLTLPNTQFGFSAGKCAFWLLKVEPKAH